MTDTPRTEDRLARLERRLRMTQVIAACAFAALVATAALEPAARPDAGDGGTLRARRLVIHDEDGRDRVVVGSPMPDPKGFASRDQPASGIAILDENGHERFAVGLKADGVISMGFDAPPGVGDARNPERINLIVASNGESAIRFMNAETRPVAMLRTDAAGRFLLEFVDWSTGKALRKQVTFAGETVGEW
jgi:hypothetical protein